MANLLATNTGFLAWDATTFLIGILAFPALVICSIIRVKLRDAKDKEKHIERLQNKIVQLETKPATNNQAIAPTQSNTRKPLTTAQQAYINDIISRAGKPRAELKREIDEIRAAKTEDELVRIFSKGSQIERPTIEAELLSVTMLAKLAELNPNINAGVINEERQNKPANPSSIGFCPKCKSEVLEGSTSYFCSRSGCNFKIAGVIVGQALNKGQVSKLLRNGRTDLLTDFVYESGERFSAWLILDARGNATLDFPK